MWKRRVYSRFKTFNNLSGRYMPKPICLTLSGGLGNQLFQLSASIFIEENLKRKVLFDVSNLLGKLIDEPGNYTRKLEIHDLIKDQTLITRRSHWLVRIINTKFKKRFFSRFYVFEKSFEHRAILDFTSRTVGAFGFFQDYEITESAWDTLKIKLENSDKFSSLIKSDVISRIAIHIRFGDYSDDPKTKQTYGLTKKTYYLDAVQEIKKSENCPSEILIVTDDVEKAKKLIQGEDIKGTIKFISNESAIQDMLELARSSHVVISNSTFSWWGAWIAYKVHNSKVIYPRPWFANESDPDLPIYVDNWMSIRRQFEIS